MDELEQIIYSMPGLKAIQLKDETYDDIVKLCKHNDFTLVKHSIGFGSHWWLMTEQYEQRVQRCRDVIMDGVLNG